MFKFCDVVDATFNKKCKQTLKSAQYGLEIIFHIEIIKTCCSYQCPVGAMKYKQQCTLSSGNGVLNTLDSAFKYSSNLLSMYSIIGFQLKE